MTGKFVMSKISVKNIKLSFADSYTKPIWKLKRSSEFVEMNLRKLYSDGTSRTR